MICISFFVLAFKTLFACMLQSRRNIGAFLVTFLFQVVDALKARNMYDNSVIIFSTDNGGPAAGLDGNSACNYPLRGMKTTLWEGALLSHLINKCNYYT